jgi:hypothetical protein
MTEARVDRNALDELVLGKYVAKTFNKKSTYLLFPISPRRHCESFCLELENITFSFLNSIHLGPEVTQPFQAAKSLLQRERGLTLVEDKTTPGFCRQWHW